MKIFIPTAGTGSRLMPLTTYINKSLISLNNKPVISYIIEQYPDHASFVVALGYKGDIVRQFLEVAYPDRDIKFVNIDKYEGEGSGLGYTMLKCKEFLQEPFIFNSCDTIVKNKIPSFNYNWVGCYNNVITNAYRTVSIDDGKIFRINEKGFKDKYYITKEYIGLCGIYDYKSFWSEMEAPESILQGESYGLNRLMLKNDITPIDFDWYDTGNLNSLAVARHSYKTNDQPDILEKYNEAIWFVNGRVIKFSDDKEFISDRVKRADYLRRFIPKITDVKDNIYAYNKIDGTVLSDIVNIPIFKSLLEYSISNFWGKYDLKNGEYYLFLDRCKQFYLTKTVERIEQFYKNFDKKDDIHIINGVEVPRLCDIMSGINWDYISDGIPGRFHGDFHFENILHTPKGFMFLDWRQNFAGDLKVGDIYYDLAKLNHGFIISHEIIANNQYNITWNGNVINYDFNRKQILVECEKYFRQWMINNKFDASKVRILTALIFLNIAALHHYPYSLLLYALGKKMLYEEI